MYNIISKINLANNVKQIEVQAPQIAKKALAGQFVMLRVSEKGERIPLTIAGKNIDKGTITFIFQEIGKTTASLGRLEPGDNIPDILGPLGHPTEIKKIGTVAAIGGGVGVAEILPVAKAYKEAGNKVIGIIGARNKDLVILEAEMKQACDQLFVTTDDGSYGQKGFVSNVLQGLIEKGEGIGLVYAIGPVPMMKVISNLTKPYNIHTIVSLNPIMVDGTGMCGACRVSVGGKTKFACVEGPEFNGHEVNWDELIKRLSLFKDKEKVSFEKYNAECLCQKK
ncbi:MAG: sulfide/dihydroorotate dehydrogenase-like FAD/NAD-binding protein [Elusimicrobia bacterium]|nr:sulfide/dihydroorotate dehydrogenase-like FAD/NAD-binding protein [Candidatus Liberimonas magnetica]